MHNADDAQQIPDECDSHDEGNMDHVLQATTADVGESAATSQGIHTHSQLLSNCIEYKECNFAYRYSKTAAWKSPNAAWCRSLIWWLHSVHQEYWGNKEAEEMVERTPICG